MSGCAQNTVGAPQVVAMPLLGEGQEGLPGSGPGLGQIPGQRGSWEQKAAES